MPYVPSKKTDGQSTDREILDVAVERLVSHAAESITNNLSLIDVYKNIFMRVARSLYDSVHKKNIFIRVARSLYAIVCGLDAGETMEAGFARTIYDVGAKYGYEGAYLGELNYALTRFIQRVPQVKMKNGTWTQELRYWIYATTVETLIYASYETRTWGIGVSGVFEDIKDECERRVKAPYEAEQILRNGDCYDMSHYTRLVKVRDSHGNTVGYQEIMLKRDPSTLVKDVLDGHFVLQKDS